MVCGGSVAGGEPCVGEIDWGPRSSPARSNGESTYNVVGNAGDTTGAGVWSALWLPNWQWPTHRVGAMGAMPSWLAAMPALWKSPFCIAAPVCAAADARLAA